MSSTKRQSEEIFLWSTSISSIPSWSANNLAGTRPPRVIVEMQEKSLSSEFTFRERLWIVCSTSFQVICWKSEFSPDKVIPNFHQKVAVLLFRGSIILRILKGIFPNSSSFSDDVNKTLSFSNGKLITITLSL